MQQVQRSIEDDGAGLLEVGALWMHRRNVRKRKKGRERI